MASKKTLTAKNLEVLGVERLAELLIEITTDDAAAKRRLRLELAGREGPAAVAGEVRKRLATIMRSHSFVDRERMPSLARDLETQRRAIVDQVAKHDPVEGLDLIWRFLELAAPVFERCDDSDGMAGDVFGLAAHDLGEIAKKAKPSPTTLADDVFQALVANDYGQYDPLIHVLAPVLGRKGLERLKQRMRSEQPADSRVRRLALRGVADAQGDVDAYIAQYDEETRKLPKIAVEIARRLLAADRADEAWQALEAAGPRAAVRHARGWLDFEWEDARIEVLEALGRHEEAQQAASSARCRPSTCAPISSDCPTSTTSRRRSGRSITRKISRTRSRHWHSWCRGPLWTGRPWRHGRLWAERPSLFSVKRRIWTATTTRS